MLGQIEGDSLIQLPGVHIYVPKAGRGQTTNRWVVSMAVLVETIIDRSVGFEKQKYVVPENATEYQTIIVRCGRILLFAGSFIMPSLQKKFLSKPYRPLTFR